ncbi:hypothetical protein O1611_g2547 [Lasiodiplodia mahajangana]|uniref:Uncharacterized protein n=1 Tax=Lasiodiplodia mahajangana TaxID=1108764 RepID=A0ACC2JUZ7_9PEZI|nr:hypothetical protein O1611_g2547 [Lasiodiplodia mahajangana]
MSSFISEPLDFTTFYNVIDGKLRKGEKTRHTLNPATLDANPDVPITTSKDVDEAVKAAQQASKHWAQVPWSERKKALEGFVAALEAYANDFIQMLVNEQGKPPVWAKDEFDTATSFLKGFCNLSLPVETIEDTKEIKVVTHYIPIGVTVGITPWNYPIQLGCGKLGPALLTGNAFILKPSPHTPYCSLKLAELGMRFFPPGVLQALSGDDDLGSLLTTHPGVNMVSFTGSASTGKKVMKQCSETLKRVTLELSGNDAAIVCAGVDPVTVAEKLTLFAFCNAGQICMSMKRVYVHDSVYDQVLAAMIDQTKSLKIGSEADSFLGPVANDAQFQRLKGLYADIETEGLKVAVGGTKPLLDRKGYFFPATIVDNPPDSATLVKQEQFGPVLPLLKWSDESDVIQRANNTDSGLGASVWTHDDAQATRIANQLEAGNVWINTHAKIMPNTPFGGHKQSGIGTEWGVEGLKAYCNLRAVTMSVLQSYEGFGSAGTSLLTNILVMARHLVFHGTLIHCLGPNELEIIEDGLIVITPDGTIATLVKSVLKESIQRHLITLGLSEPQYDIQFLERGQFLIPGFVDTHNHAPQWAQRGLGQSMHILDWLDDVTFPNEARFRDPEYARRVYASCVDGFLQQGITTASYYGSMHAEATKILADLCLEKGQRAFVGKCNMNRNAPDYYRDATVESSLSDTQDCIAHMRKIDPEGRLVKHVLTPRFAITCEDALLAGLGEIAQSNPDLPIQTHFNEAEQEMSFTKTLFPTFSNEADLYHHFGLLTRRSILAHCCYVSEYELGRLKELECGVAHCPISNMTVGGGFMAAPVREFLRRGIKVGLGTDSGGGFSSSILDAMRQALVASNAREVMSQGKDKGLSIGEVFYLATLGGARVCCFEDKIGSFASGKEFDALLIDSNSSKPGIMTILEEHDNTKTIFDKFIMTGDDRNIKQVFVRGRQVKIII